MNDLPPVLESESVTAEDLIGAPDLAAGIPPPAPAPAPSAPPPPAPDAPNPFAGQKDARGVEFHPAKFRLKDGKPQTDSLGRFVPLGTGRKSADAAGAVPPQGASSDSGSRLPPEESATPQAVPEITAEIGVEVAINLVQTALIVIGKDEGILDDLEKAMLRAPLLRVLQKYNLTAKMTPEMEAAAVIAVVVLRRLKKPNTMGWFHAKFAWLFAWWKARKVRHAVSDAIPVSAS